MSRYCDLMQHSFYVCVCVSVFGQTIRENLYAFIVQQKLLLVGVKYDSSQKL